MLSYVKGLFTSWSNLCLMCTPATVLSVSITETPSTTLEVVDIAKS